MKKVLRWSGGILIALILLLLIAPNLFKGKIIEMAKKSLNENLNAKVDFSDVSLSLIRSFPDLKVGLEELVVEGIGQFSGDTLYQAVKTSLDLDLMSVLKKNGPIEVLALHAKRPLIKIQVHSDGRANYDIVKENESESEEAGASSAIHIQWYEIENGYLLYNDLTQPMMLEMQDVTHRGKGDFSDMIFDLQTYTEAGAFTLQYGGLTYLEKTTVKLDALIGINLNEELYTLKDNHLLINELEIEGQGFIDLNPEDIELDLTVTAPRSAFRQFVSILPGAYTASFAQAEIGGSFDLSAKVLGRYSEDLIPSFDLLTRIEDGSIQYPKLPMGIKDINLDLNIKKPDGILDLMQIIMSKMRMQIGPHPLSGHLAVKTPLSDPDVEGALKGTLDLEILSKAYPVPHIQKMQGVVESDVIFDARMSQVNQKKYDQLKLSGQLRGSNLLFQQQSKPEVRIAETNLGFSPQYVELTPTKVEAGESKFELSGRFDNILALISPEEVLTGKLNINADRMNLDEWYKGQSDSARVAVNANSSRELATVPGYDLDLDFGCKELIYDEKHIQQIVLSGKVRPDLIVLHDVSASIDGSDLRLQGQMENLQAFLDGSGILRGQLELRSRRLDLNRFMLDEKAQSGQFDTASFSPIIIPANIDLDITAGVGQLFYTDMIFNDLKGKVKVQDRAATFEDCSADAFGGQFRLTGGYRTEEASSPRFDLKYDMVNVQFSQIAERISYLRVLMPIIEFLDGRFSTSLVTDGLLQKDFMPDLSSLNLAGLVETSECAVKSFGPAEQLAERLKMQFLRTPHIKNSRNWIEVKNGMVHIQEFDYEVEDVKMQISGTHSLKQDLNYLVKMKIPRKYLDANEATKQLNNQFSWLTSEASKLGFKLSNGEFINVNIILTGTIAKPQYDLKLVGMDGEKPLVDVVKQEVKAGAQHVVDSAKAVANAKKDTLMKQAEAKIDKMVDTLTSEAQKRVDTLTSKAKDELEKKLDEELSKRAGEVIDDNVGKVGDQKVDQAVDKLKDKLKGWKPFDKKNTPSDTTKIVSPKDTTKKNN